MEQPPPRKMNQNNPQDNDPQNNRPRDKNLRGRSHRDPAWTGRDRHMRGKRNPPRDKNRSDRHEPDNQSWQDGPNQTPLPEALKPTLPAIRDLSPAVPDVPDIKMAGTSAATSTRYLSYSAALKNEPKTNLNDPPCIGCLQSFIAHLTDEKRPDRPTNDGSACHRKPYGTTECTECTQRKIPLECKLAPMVFNFAIRKFIKEVVKEKRFWEGKEGWEESIRQSRSKESQEPNPNGQTQSKDT